MPTLPSTIWWFTRDMIWFSEHTVRGGLDPGSCQCARRELSPAVTPKASCLFRSQMPRSLINAGDGAQYRDMYFVEKTLLLGGLRIDFLSERLCIQLMRSLKHLWMRQGTLVEWSKTTKQKQDYSCHVGLRYKNENCLEAGTDLECQGLLFTGALYRRSSLLMARLRSKVQR